jgi:oligopeptide/dipeptide ABC transporter ATP-binding protein
MYLGQIVESAPHELLWSRPLHPYSRGLIAAVPVPDPKAAQHQGQPAIEGEIPSPADPPSGCRFRTRCWKAQQKCTDEEPTLDIIGPAGQPVACHFPESGPLR